MRPSREVRPPQHMVGEAADIDTGDRQQNKLLFEYIRKNLPYDQLIDESNLRLGARQLSG